jgi:energy-coupling factor transporter ATP-binding protein EcfA2
MHNPDQITYFAETNARGQKVKFGIKAKDRTRHVYVIGKTGTGKSTMLENMAIQDIHNGNGLCFLDPHGMTADKLMEYIPEERKKDVLYIAPFDMDHPVSFNIMEDVGYDKRHLVVGGLMSAFKKIWQDAWSARMEYILTNTLFALLEYPDATLLSVNKMLADKAFRKKVVDNIKDTSVKSFWVDEFANYTERFAQEATPAIQNKVGQFTTNPVIRNIIGQPKSSFDLRKLMDEKKIVIVNLSKGRVGEANANLLGSLLVTKIYLSAMSRADLNNKDLEALPNFYLYVDEFQSFANESFADILSEARKYKLNLTIAHQYIEQMPEEVRDAVFGNVGTMITFRVGAYDAEVLEKEMAPAFTAEDIVNLGFAEIYLRLMIDGMGSKPFSARTVLPDINESNLSEEIIEESRKNFSSPRSEVEERIKELVGMGDNKDQKSNNNQSNRNNFQKPKHKKTPTPKPKSNNQNQMKKAFEGIDLKEIKKESKKEMVKTEDQKGISLEELKKPQNKKSVSSENRSSLKDALSKVMVEKSKQDKKPEQPKSTKKENKKELSEEELRKMLEI